MQSGSLTDKQRLHRALRTGGEEFADKERLKVGGSSGSTPEPPTANRLQTGSHRRVSLRHLERYVGLESD